MKTLSLLSPLAVGSTPAIRCHPLDDKGWSAPGRERLFVVHWMTSGPRRYGAWSGL